MLTQEDDDADEDGDEGARAEPHGQEDGLSAAGQERPVAIAGAHAHRQGPGAAQDGVANVLHHHGQQVEVLDPPAKTAPPGHHPRRVV